VGWKWRFFKRVPIIPGVRVNLSRGGASVSLGRRGSWLTIGRRGVRRTVGMPGTGIYATDERRWDELSGIDREDDAASRPPGR
jgi:hypothetical protein